MAGEPPLLRVKNAVIEPLPHAARAWLVRLTALVAFLLVWWLITALHLVDEKFLPMNCRAECSSGPRSPGCW